MKVAGWKHWTSGGNVRFSHYVESGEDALIIVADNGERLTTATVALWPPSPRAEDGEAWLKGWGQNEGLPEALQAAGIVTLTDRFEATGYEAAQLAKLTPEAIAYRDANRDPEAKAAQEAARRLPR